VYTEDEKGWAQLSQLFIEMCFMKGMYNDELHKWTKGDKEIRESMVRHLCTMSLWKDVGGTTNIVYTFHAVNEISHFKMNPSFSNYTGFGLTLAWHLLILCCFSLMKIIH